MPTRLVTVAIGVVTAKQGIAPVTTDDAFIIANGLSRRSVSKVLAVVLGAVAEAEDMLLCMISQGDGIGEPLPQLGHFGGIARFVDQEVLGGALIPRSIIMGMAIRISTRLNTRREGKGASSEDGGDGHGAAHLVQWNGCRCLQLNRVR